MKILIKIGSVITIKDNKFNYELIKEKVKEISALYRRGDEVIIVSSGAVACGMEIENLRERPRNTLKLQLLSGEGQITLMKNYQELFKKEGIKISQVLLTHHNFDTNNEKPTLIKIINSYLKQKIIPIINENDLISKEEFDSDNMFSDNDTLAALLARDLKVNLVLILTDVDGLHSSNPKTNSDSALIEEIKEINEEIKNMASKETSSLGLGGMYSKIIAAEMLTNARIDVIVANGNLNINDILKNKVKRTLFLAKLK